VAATALIDRLRSEHAAVAASLPAHVVPSARRQAALAALAEHGLPSSRDENWRYANLRLVERGAFAAAAAAALDPTLLPAAIPRYTRFVFVNGLLTPSLSASLEPRGGFAATRGFARGTQQTAIPMGDERFRLVSDAFATDGLALELSGSELQAIEIVFATVADATQGTAYPRLWVRAAEHSRVSIIERHVSAGAAAITNANVALTLANGAHVDHVRWQSCDPKAHWIDTLTAEVGPSANYRLRYIATGAAASRSTLRVSLTGHEAASEIAAACVGDGTQVMDVFAEIDHVGERSATRELFRGVAGGRSNVAFNGKMIVRQEARGAASEQSLRSLLAGPEAEIAARPQLEIYTDEVRASHGATAGKLDDTMLFYLLSRGIDRDTAQSLLKWAFLEDVLTQIEPQALRREIELRLSGRFADIAALDGLLGNNP
jgi:Fe-S cluster assembly protein SufD